MPSRREFLQKGVGLISAYWLGDWFPRLALAEPVAPTGARRGEFLVYLKTLGGLDCTLGLDPWILPPGADKEDLFLEYRPDEIISAGGLRLGPAAKPLVAHAKDCLILNGIMMRRDAGHDVGNLYMASGRGDGKAAEFPLEVGVATGTAPFGVVINTSAYTAAKPVSLSTTKDLEAEAEDGSIVELIEERIRLLAANLGTPLETAEKQVIEGKVAALSLVEWMKKLKPAGGPLLDYQVMAAALVSGATRQAVLDLSGNDFAGIVGLDSHSAHEKNHLAAQLKVWEKVATIFDLFKSLPFRNGSLFDATTFVVFSEFSRTPALNAAKGKDHNPFTNSALIAGRGIQGGKVVGASRLITRKQSASGMPDHIAWPFDYKAGKLAEGPNGASFFFPENLTRTLAELFGPVGSFGAIDAKTNVIPGILK